MNLLHDDIKKGLAGLIKTGLQAMGVEENADNIYQALGPAPRIEMGHYAYPLFPFAKSLRNAPARIAAELASKLPESDLFAQAKAEGPYLNFILPNSKLGQFAAAPILDGSFFKKQLTENAPKSMIEYSQPNTHKELHVGHMRNLALGDALIRMHRYCDYDIISATFPGDVGMHVAKCLWYMKNVNKEPAPEENKGEWLGKMYSLASVLIKDAKKAGEDAEINAATTKILKQLEAQKGEYYELWKETRAWSIELMQQVYKWAGVEFDAWYWESDVDAPSVALAKEWYENGFLEVSDGAIGKNLEEWNLGFALVLKGDGTGLYLTKDLLLAKRKFEDYKVEHSIYIVDKRQARHFQQVFKVLELAGFEQAKDCYHLQYDYVELPDGAMSSRDGNIVPIMRLIEEMEKAIRENYLQKQIDEGTMSQAEAQKIAEIVARGAIKYGMIRIDTTKKIVFRMEEWIDIKGDSGPYQQYTYARINSLCAKQNFDPAGAIDWDLLDDPRETELLVKAADFNNVVLSATQQNRTSVLTSWLYELARLYNNVNNAIIIRDIEDPVLKNTRLALAMMVAKVIEQGLAVLGIGVPEKM